MVGAAQILRWNLDLGALAIHKFQLCAFRWLNHYGGVVVEIHGDRAAEQPFRRSVHNKGRDREDMEDMSIQVEAPASVQVTAAFNNALAAALWMLSVRKSLPNEDWYVEGWEGGRGWTPYD